MKIDKFIIFLFIFLLSVNSVKASENWSSYCVQPYDLSLKGTQILTNITGMSFLSRSIANSVIKNELKKASGTNGFKVKMKTYSAKDLLDGRFKSLNITGKNLDIDGLHISNFSADTVCDFNYVKATTKSVTFKDNFIMKYNLDITEDDLRKTVISDDYVKKLKSLNLNILGLNLFELKNVDVKLENNKFYYMLGMNNKIFNKSIPLNLVISANVAIVNGKIKTRHITLENFNTKLISISQASKLLNLINPLSFTINIAGNSNSKITLSNMIIQDKKIILDGILFIPKNTEEKRS